MTIIFGLIAENGNMRGEYFTKKENKSLGQTVITQILPKLQKTDQQKTVEDKEHKLSFHLKYNGNYVFLVVAYSDYPKRMCWACIEAMETDFMKNTQNPKSVVSGIIKQHVKHFGDLRNDKISGLKTKVESVKSEMIDNIDRLLDRGQKLETLFETTEELTNFANDFNRGTRSVKRSMCGRYVAIVLIIIIVLLLVLAVIIIIIIIAACAGGKCGGSQ